jgi:hypothetical protein
VIDGAVSRKSRTLRAMSVAICGSKARHGRPGLIERPWRAFDPWAPLSTAAFSVCSSWTRRW